MYSLSKTVQGFWDFHSESVIGYWARLQYRMHNHKQNMPILLNKVTKLSNCMVWPWYHKDKSYGGLSRNNTTTSCTSGNFSLETTQTKLLIFIISDQCDWPVAMRSGIKQATQDFIKIKGLLRSSGVNLLYGTESWTIDNKLP